MSLLHTLEDGEYNDVTKELRDIKAIARMLGIAGEDDVEGEDVSALGYLVFDMVKKIEGLMSDKEEAPAPATDPIKITDTETFKKLEEGAESQTAALKLSDYDPQYANAKVSVIALWKALDRLDAVADDPNEVKGWLMDIHSEIQQCQVA